jgi:hypothetical protein
MIFLSLPLQKKLLPKPPQPLKVSRAPPLRGGTWQLSIMFSSFDPGIHLISLHLLLLFLPLTVTERAMMA